MNVDDYLDADAMTALMSSLIDVGTSVALAGLTLIAGLIFSGFVRKTIRRLAMANENVDDTLGNFFASLAYYAIMAMVLIAVLDPALLGDHVVLNFEYHCAGESIVERLQRQNCRVGRCPPEERPMIELGITGGVRHHPHINLKRVRWIAHIK